MVVKCWIEDTKLVAVQHFQIQCQFADIEIRIPGRFILPVVESTVASIVFSFFIRVVMDSTIFPRHEVDMTRLVTGNEKPTVSRIADTSENARILVF